MKQIAACIVVFAFLGLGAQSFAQEEGQKKASPPSIAEKTSEMEKRSGYFDFYWDATEGEIWLEIANWDEEFLYVNALASGVGSNDIGLDRNQLGQERVVKFQRVGKKVLMVQPNYRFRAVSDNPEEAKSVEEAFAQSILWGFKVESEEDGKVLVNLTPFLLRDAHGIVGRLKNSKPKQGDYSVDGSRSAIYLERTKNFPKNTEFEGLVTYKGSPTPQASWIRSVTPTAEFITVRQHHSFIQLPDDDYEPRVFDPRSGYIPISYQDYATPISEPLVKRFIIRHRLKKKNPEASISEAVEPIVYYLDRGAPEPIKSALIEGASWWNQAFEAAGYKDAFQVKVLPEDADLLDIRYNVINWVHRSTRGWSYGASVVDPRTGEILKGNISLGSLRVRQDFLIVQGLVDAYADGVTPDPRMEEVALARLRQLSAHEVGHTLGLLHNFSASAEGRSSVMDYPYPFIQLDGRGELDFSEAYDAGIGDWDKRAILYGYQVEAVTKLIGGVNYSYAVRGGNTPRNEMIDDAIQREALDALITTIQPGFLALPEDIIQLIPPQPVGYRRDRELFQINTGLTFDPIAAAESSASSTIRLLLNPQRLARLVEHHARDNARMSIYELFDQLLDGVTVDMSQTSFEQEIARSVEKRVVANLLHIAANKNGLQQVAAAALLKVDQLEERFRKEERSRRDPAQKAHLNLLLREIALFNEHPETFAPSIGPEMPDGSPIGCSLFHSHTE